MIRRLDCVLDDTRPAVLARAEELARRIDNPNDALCAASGHEFYNLAPINFAKLTADPEHIADNLRAHIGLRHLDLRAEARPALPALGPARRARRHPPPNAGLDAQDDLHARHRAAAHDLRCSTFFEGTHRPGSLDRCVESSTAKSNSGD